MSRTAITITSIDQEKSDHIERQNAEHHLAQMLPAAIPFPQKIRKRRDHVDQVCSKSDQEAVQELHSKQHAPLRPGG
ncbi:MAG: hypothetical protein ACLUAR_00845 [Pilosibacter sp.]